MSESHLGRGAVTDRFSEDNKLSPRDRLLRRLRATARERFWSTVDRDAYECPACGRSDVPIDVHHRDGDPFNNHLLNLVGVCPRCHRNEHRRRATVGRVNDWKQSLPGD